MISYKKDFGRNDNGYFTYLDGDPVMWAVYDKANIPLGVVVWSELHPRKDSPVAHFKVKIAHCASIPEANNLTI